MLGFNGLTIVSSRYGPPIGQVSEDGGWSVQPVRRVLRVRLLETNARKTLY